MTCVNIPALVIGSVRPPIPFNVTIGTLYCEHDFIDDKYFECAKETEPQESNLTSLIVLTILRFSLLCRMQKWALLISVDSGDMYRPSEM